MSFCETPAWVGKIAVAIRSTGDYPGDYHPLEVQLTCRIMLDRILAINSPEVALARAEAIACVEMRDATAPQASSGARDSRQRSARTPRPN